MDTSHLRVEGNWKAMWSLKIPNKFKILIWRIVRGCFPTRCRLQQKGVQCTEFCPMCSEFPENEWHLFFGFYKAQQVWEAAALWNLISTDFLQAESASELFFKLLEQLDDDAKTDFAAVIWCLWRQRNDMVWNSNDRPIRLAIHEAKSLIAAWQFHRKPAQQNLETSNETLLLTTSSVGCNQL